MPSSSGLEHSFTYLHQYSYTSAYGLMTMGRSVSESSLSSTHAGFRPKPDDGVYTSGLGAPRTRSASRPTRSWQRQRASSRWRCTPSLSSSMSSPTSPPCTSCMLASTVNTHPARCSALCLPCAPSGEGGHWACAALPFGRASSILCFHRDPSIQPGNVCVRATVCVRTQDPFAIMCFYRNKPLRLDCGYGPEPKITALGATSAALVSVLAASIREARGALGVVVARPRRINT